MQAVEERVSDQSVLGLLRVILRAGVLEHGQVRRSVMGAPQGGGATRGRTVVSGCTKGGSMVMV